MSYMIYSDAAWPLATRTRIVHTKIHKVVLGTIICEVICQVVICDAIFIRGCVACLPRISISPHTGRHRAYSKGNPRNERSEEGLGLPKTPQNFLLGLKIFPSHVNDI